MTNDKTVRFLLGRPLRTSAPPAFAVVPGPPRPPSFTPVFPAQDAAPASTLQDSLQDGCPDPPVALLGTVLEVLPHAVLVVDADWRVVLANAAARALLASGSDATFRGPAPLAPESPSGDTLWDVIPGLSAGAVGRCCREARAERRPQVVEAELPGHRGTYQVHAVPEVGGQLVLHAREVTADRRPAGADRDVLTGAGNRQAFLERLAAAVGQVRAAPPGDDGRRPVVLLFDVDGLAAVNAGHGHDAGDQLLQRVAECLGRGVGGEDAVGRVGADEFAVLLASMAPDEEVAAGERLLAALSTLVAAPHAGVRVTACLGTVAVDGSADAEAVLRYADLALARAKAGGPGRVGRFTAALRAEVRARDEVAAALYAAVRWLTDDTAAAGHGFSLVYQPVVELATGAPVGVEALLRWRDSVLGVVSPATFIPLAEELGLIAPVGQWVLRTACAAIGGLLPGLLPGTGGPAAALTVSVNVSGRQLAAGGFADEVAAALAAASLPPARLTLELTETALVSDARRARRVLGELRALGVRVAIDDFGAGYASLGYLQQLPLDVLKIDRSFVAGATRGTGPSVAIPRAMVALGQALGLRTVGEGVETVAQRDALVALGCGYGQGYLFARPLALPDLAAWLGAAAGGTGAPA